MLSAAALRKKLGLTPAKLAGLVKQGLPCKGKGSKRQFDPAKVAAWLRERGLARQVAVPPGAEQFVTTIAEAAQLLEVAPRTFAGWLTDPTFPGKAGTPGRRDGYFPIAAIRAWHLATHGVSAKSAASDEVAAAAKRMRAQIQNDREQVALEKDLGTIGDTEEMAAFCRRVAANAKALLDELADRVNARLPAKYPAAIRAINRKVINESVADILHTIAELVTGVTDATDDVPDD